MTDSTIIRQVITRARIAGRAYTVTEYRHDLRADGIITGATWSIDPRCFLLGSTPGGDLPIITHVASCRCYSGAPRTRQETP